MTPRICIPIQVKPEGGMYTFVGNFRKWLDEQHWPHTHNLDDEFDVLFVNSWVVPPSVVRRVKKSRPNVRVAHRIDGSSVDYGGDPAADGIQARVNLLADVTIFQSQYSRHATREKFKVVAQDGPVIYNAVDVAQFTPKGPVRELPKDTPLVACASFSVNRRKGTWLVDQLAAQRPDVTFVLCGRFDAVTDRPNIIRLGHLTRDEMAAAFRSCHVFLNLSENESCPNVVLEALASGLPVLYRDSGAAREVVADCGMAFEPEMFSPALTQMLSDRRRLSELARQRAMVQFAPSVIFPQYIRACSSAVRAEIPSRLRMLRLAGAGYPVLPRLRTPSEVAGAIERRMPIVFRRAGARQSRHTHRVGWVTYDSFPGRKTRFAQLDSFTGMRVGNVAQWINAHQSDILNELYVPHRHYDVVVFQKMMDVRCQREAAKVKAAGGRVVFDANVNYYEVWGDYFVPGTEPTEQQRNDAARMTKAADCIVADSTYLREVIARGGMQAQWIPDNVNLTVYNSVRRHSEARPVRLVWSGIGKKALHLLSITVVLSQLRNVELLLVVDEPPDCLAELRRALPCTVVKFSDETYAATLQTCDIIISPKRLINGYEMAHTEYKITLGMAAGLPAVASPQQSYVEAITHRGGGFIVSSDDEWRQALTSLISSADLRAELGALARQTVVERYATEVVAASYLELLRQTVGAGDAQRSAMEKARSGN